MIYCRYPSTIFQAMLICFLFYSSAHISGGEELCFVRSRLITMHTHTYNTQLVVGIKKVYPFLGLSFTHYQRLSTSLLLTSACSAHIVRIRLLRNGRLGQVLKTCRHHQLETEYVWFWGRHSLLTCFCLLVFATELNRTKKRKSHLCHRTVGTAYLDETFFTLRCCLHITSAPGTSGNETVPPECRIWKWSTAFIVRRVEES